MKTKKSFSIIGVLMATVIFLLISTVIISNIVLLIRTNNYKKYFLVGNYLANEGVEVTKAILNRNVEKDLAKAPLDNPGLFDEANKRWKVYWDEGISPKSSIGMVGMGDDISRVYGLDISLGVIESGLQGGVDLGVDSTLGAEGFISGPVTGGIDIAVEIERRITIRGVKNENSDPDIYEPVFIELQLPDGSTQNNFYSPRALSVTSEVIITDGEGGRYSYVITEKIPRPNLYNK